MFKYMYIDESGDLGMKGSKFLILAALMVDDPRELERIIKNMRRNKFKKELRKSQEIKANKSSRAVIRYMLQKLNEVKGCKVFYIVLEKRKLLSEYLKNNKHKLYNYVAGKLAKHITFDSMDIELKIDRSKGKQLLQEDFNRYIWECIGETSDPIRVKIEHSHSHCWAGLQFADVLAWSCFQKFEHGDSSYVDLIKVEQEVYHVW